jgi:hypothetical protein
MHKALEFGMVKRSGFIAQPAQPVQGTAQDLGEGDQRRHGRPFLSVFEIPNGNITNPDHVGQGLLRPSMLFPSRPEAFAKNLFRMLVCHLVPNYWFEYNCPRLTIG